MKCVCVCVCVCVFSRVDSFVTSWTVFHQAPLSMGFPGKNTGVGCHFLLQGISLTQGSNPCLLLDKRIYQSNTWKAPCLCDRIAQTVKSKAPGPFTFSAALSDSLLAFISSFSNSNSPFSLFCYFYPDSNDTLLCPRSKILGMIKIKALLPRRNWHLSSAYWLSN